MTLFDLLTNSTVFIKGFEKKVSFRLINSLTKDDQDHNTVLHTDAPRGATRKLSRLFLIGTNKELDLTKGNINIKAEDCDEGKFIAALIKENSTLTNKVHKEEIEKKIFHVFKKTQQYINFLKLFRIDDQGLKQVSSV